MACRSAGIDALDIVFSDICIGSENQSRKQTLSLQYCENITFERIRCL